MAQETNFENRTISKFKDLVTLTLTSATLGVYPVVCKLLLIFRSAKGRRLS